MVSEQSEGQGLTPLPIDRVPPRSRRSRRSRPQVPWPLVRRIASAAFRVAATIALVLGAVATLRWVVGDIDEAGDGTTAREAPPATAAQTTAPPAAAATPSSTTPPAAPAPGTGGPVLDTAGVKVTLSPAAGLADGQVLEMSANISPNDVVGLTAHICAIGSSTACTQISPLTVVLPSENVRASMIVPRRFNTVTGDTHDCVESSPCELRVLLAPLQTEPLTAPLAFDPDAALRPIETVDITPLGPYANQATVRLVSDVVTEYELLQCASGAPTRCEQLSQQIDQDAPGERVQRSVLIHRTINTPAGSFDCVADGNCELRAITGADILVFPVALEFDASINPDPSPAAIARPRVGLGDGTEIEIRVADRGNFSYLAALCKVDSPACASLGSLTAGSGGSTGQFRLPRRFNALEFNDLVKVDCVADGCEVRVTTGRATTSIAIAFDPSLPDRPAARLLLDSPPRLTPGDEVTLRGRDFLVVDADNPPWVDLSICPTGTTSQMQFGCVSLRRSPTIVREDGTFDAVFTVSSADAIRPIVSADLICDPGCVIIGATRLDGFGTAELSIPVEIISPDD